MKIGDRVTYFKRRNGNRLYQSATRIVGIVRKINKTQILIEVDGTGELIRAYADNCEVTR